MKSLQEPVRSLETQETGEMRRLRCVSCGRRFFQSFQDLYRHEMLCVKTPPDQRVSKA